MCRRRAVTRTRHASVCRGQAWNSTRMAVMLDPAQGYVGFTSMTSTLDCCCKRAILHRRWNPLGLGPAANCRTCEFEAANPSRVRSNFKCSRRASTPALSRERNQVGGGVGGQSTRIRQPAFRQKIVTQPHFFHKEKNRSSEHATDRATLKQVECGILAGNLAGPSCVVDAWLKCGASTTHLRNRVGQTRITKLVIAWHYTQDATQRCPAQ